MAKPVLQVLVDWDRSGAWANTHAIQLGAASRASVSDDTAIQNIWDSGGTIEFWLKATEDALDGGGIVDKGNWTISPRDFSGGKARLRLFVKFSGGNGTWDTDRVLTLGKYHHCAVTFDADSPSNDPTITIDGVSVGVTEANTPSGTRSTDVGEILWFGSQGGTSGVLGGSSEIDEIRLWNDIRTLTEIQENMHQVIVSVPASLVGYWRLNDGSGTTAVDSSGNGNDATWAGTFAWVTRNTEDMTSDVVSMALDHLRDMQTDYMNGRVLDLILKNDDHKYSPPKQQIMGLKPGRLCWVRCFYPFDTFDGAAGTQLASHTPDQDSNWSWVEDLNNFDLDGSGAALTDSTFGNGDCVATMDFAQSDVTIGATIERNNGAIYPGLCIRYVDSSNYAYVRLEITSISIREVVGGSDTQVAQFTGLATIGTEFLSVQCHGSKAFVWLNDEYQGEGSLNSALDGGTKFGLFSDEQTTSNDNKWLDFGGYKQLFFGRVDAVRPRPAQGNQYSYVRATDAFEQFKSVPVLGKNYTIASGSSDGILNHLLLTVKYGSGDQYFGQLKDTGTTIFDDVDKGLKGLESDLLSLIYQLQDEEDGFIYFDPHNTLRLENRTHRDSAPHTVSQATINDTYDGSNPGFVGMSWEDGQEGVENDITATIIRGSETGATTVWVSEQAQDTTVAIQLLGANAEKEFVVKLRDYDAANNWITPVATTDYEANAQADGGGTDLTGDVSVTIVDQGIYDGHHRKLKVTLDSGTLAYIIKLQLRADGFTFEDPTDISDVDDDSANAYGERRKIIKCIWIHEDDEARSLIASRLAHRKDPKAVVDVTLANADKPTLHHMVQRRISDRVTLDYSDMGINEKDFFIEGESWEFREGGTDVRCTFQLRAV